LKEALKTLRIALAGNPNSGKTSIFNAMTGARQKVGNWPGVTVEKKTGVLTYGNYRIQVIDLPGTYSLTSYSVEERAARSFIVEERPDVVIHVVDAGNLARNLYLTVQLLELGVDLVVDLNMWDDFEDSGATLDRDKLCTLLGSPVVSTIGHRGEGVDELIAAAVRLAEERCERHRHVPISYGSHVDDVLAELVDVIEAQAGLEGDYPFRWVAIKLLEGDDEIVDLVRIRAENAQPILELVERASRHIYNATGADPEKVISEGRYGYIEGALKVSMTKQKADRMALTRQIDNVFTNRFLGYPIFFLFVWLLFQATFKLGSYPMEWIDRAVGWLSATAAAVLPESLVSDLIIDGIIGGVGSVAVFLPNILILFLGVSILEDSGYMARAAFLMDRIMHALGLHGKSFIPMLMGFGCSVPAIMATRTLESERDRILTILLVPLMSCSARMPVYILIAGTFFAERAGSIVFLIYTIGIVVALLIGRLFAKTIFRSAHAPFVMELPPYRAPTVKGLLTHMWERGRLYVQKMGGVILVASIILWFLGAFPQQAELTTRYNDEVDRLNAIGSVEALDRVDELEMELAAIRAENSYIGRAGKLIEPVISPLGYSWQMGVSLITGFVAKEVVVSTLGVLYHAGEGDTDTTLPKVLRDPSSGISPLAAFGFMVFVLLYTPCIAAVAAVRREAGTRWMLFSIAYQSALAWFAGFAIYRVGCLLGLG